MIKTQLEQCLDPYKSNYLQQVLKEAYSETNQTSNMELLPLQLSAVTFFAKAIS